MDKPFLLPEGVSVHELGRMCGSDFPLSEDEVRKVQKVSCCVVIAHWFHHKPEGDHGK